MRALDSVACAKVAAFIGAKGNGILCAVQQSPFVVPAKAGTQ
jgi:hypothetical protein